MIWEMRENIAGAGVKQGYTLKYDVSLSTDHYYRLVEETRKLIACHPSFTDAERKSMVTVGYGHVGDGNLHLNVTLPYADTDL
jgi:FAD/FMN-containing dehydrogenase